MALQVEDMDRAIPNGLALKHLAHSRDARQLGLSAMLAFNRSLELVDGYVLVAVFLFSDTTRSCIAFRL
jgi:hypothetical protein